MPSTGTLGGTLPWGPKSLQVKRQAFPHDGSRGLKRPAPASAPVTDNHHGAGAKGAPGCGRKVREFLGWHRGRLLLSWSPTPEPSPPKPVPFWALQEKQLLKDSPEHFVAGMDKYFPTSFRWPLSVLLSYWEEIYSQNWGLPLWWGVFQPLELYSSWLLPKNPLHLLQQRGTKNYGRTKLTPRCGAREFLDKPTKLNWSSLSSEIPLGFLTGKISPQKRGSGGTTAFNKQIPCLWAIGPHQFAM